MNEATLEAPPPIRSPRLPPRVTKTQGIRNPQYRIPELDGLRGLAAIFVVSAHMVMFSRALPSGHHDLFRQALECLGRVGLDVFFVISGFIITKLLWQEWRETSAVSLRAFYLRRAFRILPPFIVYFLVILALSAGAVIIVRPSAFVLSALFLTNLAASVSNPNGGWFVGHTWSLSVEEQFYICFPVVVCLWARFRLLPTILVLGFVFGLSEISDGLERITSISLGTGGLRHFRYICVGVAFARFEGVAPGWLAGSSRPTALGIWLAVIGLRMLDLATAGVPFHAVIHFVCGSIEPLALVAGVIWFVRNPARCEPLRWGGLQWLGACSYSIYLWQQLFTGRPEFYGAGWLWPLAQSPVLAWVAILACAALSHYFVELPCIQFGKRVVARLQAGKAVPLHIKPKLVPAVR